MPQCAVEAGSHLEKPMTAVLTFCSVAVTQMGSEPLFHHPGRPVRVALNRVNFPSWPSNMLLPTMPWVSAHRPGAKTATVCSPISVYALLCSKLCQMLGHSLQNWKGTRWWKFNFSTVDGTWLGCLHNATDRRGWLLPSPSDLDNYWTNWQNLNGVW